MLNIQPSPIAAKLRALVVGLWLLALIAITTRAQENSPPTIGPLDGAVVAESENYSVVIPATDPDAPPALAITASGLPPGAACDPALRRFTWTPQPGQEGVWADLAFQVTDGELQDLEAVTVTVLDSIGACAYESFSPPGGGSPPDSTAAAGRA